MYRRILLASLTIAILLCVKVFANPPAKVIYVDNDAVGANDGTSWQNAYNFLQDALGDARSSDTVVEIRVAQGSYKPDQGAVITPGDRYATFQLLNGVSLKGGYNGIRAPDPDDRDVTLYKTVLSGDLANNDIYVVDKSELTGIPPDKQDNAVAVVSSIGVDSTATINGLTIAAGRCGIFNESGAPCVNDCTFLRNWGSGYGAVQNQGRGSPTFIRCRFTENRGRSGGAMHSSSGNPQFINCIFLNNTAYAEDGGAIASRKSSTLISECLFEGNSATSGHGGAISNREGDSVIMGCRFIGNSAWQGGGIYNVHGKCIIKNCVLAGNLAFCLKVDPYSACGREPITGEGGGVFFVFDQETLLYNCTIVGNRADFHGGGVYCSSNDHPKISNCILWNNRDSSTFVVSAQVYGGKFIFTPYYKWMDLGCLRDCVFFSCVQDSFLDWNNCNIQKGPLFADPGYWDPNGTPEYVNDDFWVDGDYHLKSQAGRWEPISQTWVKDDVTSPCIDAGDPASPIGNEPFPNGGRINMGAYGGTAEASKSYFSEPICETIVAGDINGDCKVDFRDFVIMSIHWLEDRTVRQR